MNKTGIDISKIRLDDLDKEFISFAIKNKINNPTKRFADFGCGSAKVSVCVSSLGYTGELFDIKNYKKRFKDISKSLGINLNYTKSKIEDIKYSDFPKKLDMVICQRTLHYLTYKDTKSFLKKVKKNLNGGGRLFVSFSGLNSKLASGYDIEKDISKRYFKISKDNQSKFEIRNLVCLYSKKEVGLLLEEVGFKKVRLWESDFGNVKAIYEKV